ncbi:MAG: hypothetical protein QOE68_2542, partial [Thermoanaerobaculia bacterium]|nr:hypothetical protein [Thermoanaerobaculia bacterium]
MHRILIALLFITSTASADYTITVSKNAAGTVTIAQTGFTPPVTTITADTPLTIICESSLTDAECSQISASIGQVGVPLTDGRTATGTVRANLVSSTGTRFRILNNGAEIAGGPVLQLINGQGPASQPVDGNQPPAVQGIAHPCDGIRITPSYEEKENRAHFVVTPGGSFLQQPSGPVDENDVVVFHVVSTDQALLQRLEVVRASATRSTEALSTIAAGTSVRRQSAGPAQPCFRRRYELGDFAPGEGKVEMYTMEGTEKKVQGTPTFNVNRLWHGIMSFGPMRSSINTQAFGLTPRDGKNFIVRTEESTSDLVYVVQYTQYWRRRDTEKTLEWYHNNNLSYPWLQHINPSIGIALEDTLKQAFVGLSVDWQRFVFTVGAHVRDVKILPRGSGLTVGGEFTGTTIPLETERKTGLYV